MEKRQSRKKAPVKREYIKDPFAKLKDGKPYNWAGPIDNDIAVAIFTKYKDAQDGATVRGIINSALRTGLKKELTAKRKK